MKSLYSVGELVLAVCVALLTVVFALRAKPASPLPEPTAAVPTEAPRAPTEPVTAAQSAPEPAGELYVLPEDIAQKADAFMSRVKEESPAGEVEETFFDAQGSTVQLGNVKVKNTTKTHAPDFEALLEKKTALVPADLAAPTVLIFHTHTSEGYLPDFTGHFYSGEATRSSDPTENVVRVGRRLAETLEQAGIGVIHDERVYDEVYTGAYAKSREKVLDYLEQYPSLQVVLDVHRDAIYETKTSALKPTAEIDGRKTAQIMIITGAPEGEIEGCETWEQNLAFALHLQKKAQDIAPGLMRPLFFCPRRYNMDVTPCALLLEVGSDVNTLSEADHAAYLIGKALAEVIREESQSASSLSEE